jgi:hypothetical protein
MNIERKLVFAEGGKAILFPHFRFFVLGTPCSLGHFCLVK